MEYDVTFKFQTEITVRVTGEGPDDAYGAAECELAAAFDPVRAQIFWARNYRWFDSDRWRIEEVKLALEQAAADRMDDHYPLPVSVTEGQVRMEPVLTE
jgi:hypothetical protein